MTLKVLLIAETGCTGVFAPSAGLIYSAKLKPDRTLSSSGPAHWMRPKLFVLRQQFGLQRRRLGPASMIPCRNGTASRHRLHNHEQCSVQPLRDSILSHKRMLSGECGRGVDGQESHSGHFCRVSLSKSPPLAALLASPSSSQGDQAAP
jgi:hypothetical protein